MSSWCIFIINFPEIGRFLYDLVFYLYLFKYLVVAMLAFWDSIKVVKYYSRPLYLVEDIVFQPSVNAYSVYAVKRFYFVI